MTEPLNILADADIPLVAEAFGAYGAVRSLPGEDISASELKDVDVLLVRSVTRINEDLLADSSVRFVGTATAGMDHIDVNYLMREGVGFAAAPGANAESVVEYILAALISSAVEQAVGLQGRTLGVVGCGRIGGAVADRAGALGMRVLRCDPPLAERWPGPSPFVSLGDVLLHSDFVTCHTPLTFSPESPHPTFHLLGVHEFERMKSTAVLLNTSRGGVADNSALREALSSQRIGGAVLDVWENEPDIDVELARLASIATSHIAGYGYDGKVAATRILEEALRSWLIARADYVPKVWSGADPMESGDSGNLELHALPVDRELDGPNEVRWLNVLVRQAYNLRNDDMRFRQNVLGASPQERVDAFRELRRTYPVRRSWERFSVKTIIPDRLREVVTQGLCMSMAN